MTIDPAYPTFLMLGCDPRAGFYVSCVLLPRFTLLAAGPFDEEVNRAEDTLYWLRLALRNTKAINIDAELAVRRLIPDRLTAPPKPVWVDLFYSLRVALLCLAEPRHWPVVAHGIATVRSILTKQDEYGAITPASRAAFTALVTAFCALEDRGGMTTLPLLAQCRHLLSVRRRGIDNEALALLRVLQAAVHGAALNAAPLTQADLRYWRDTAVTVSANGRLNAFCAHAERAVARSASALPLIDELLRHSTGIPKQRAIRRYLKLRQLAVPRWLALRLCG